MVALSEKKIIIIVLSSQYCVMVEAAKIRVLLQLIADPLHSLFIFQNAVHFAYLEKNTKNLPLSLCIYLCLNDFFTVRSLGNILQTFDIY